MKDAVIKEITVNRNKYKILCHKEEEERVEVLTARVDERGAKITNAIKHKPSDTTLFLLIALELEDAVENLQTEIKNLQKNDDSKEKIVNQIVFTIENFIKKIENSSC